MTDKFLDSWSKIRRKGKWRFITIYGVLLWGSLTVIIKSAIQFFLFKNLSLPEFFITIPLFAISGILVGYVLWFMNERRYKKLNNKE